MVGRRSPKTAKNPHVTNRRQFKAWLILSLAERGIQLPPEPSYRDIQHGLELAIGDSAVKP